MNVTIDLDHAKTCASGAVEQLSVALMRIHSRSGKTDWAAIYEVMDNAGIDIEAAQASLAKAFKRFNKARDTNERLT